MSADVDLAKVMLTAQDLIGSGVGLVDGETKLTKHLISQMSFDDVESMLGEYLVNFILVSALKKMKQA